MPITAENLRLIGADIREAVRAVERKHGVAVGFNKFSFHSAQAVCQMVITSHEALGQQQEATTGVNATNVKAILASSPYGASHVWTRNWMKQAKRLGFDPADLGRYVKYGKNKLRVGGITERSPHGKLVLCTRQERQGALRYLVVSHKDIAPLLRSTVGELVYDSGADERKPSNIHGKT